MATLPTSVTSAGLTPQAPADIRAKLLADVGALSPGFTGNLPGTLIEDIASTDVAAIVQCDSARVDAVASLTPGGANDFLLSKLGQQAGIPLADAIFTSVSVIFFGPPGYVIPIGFEVSDGTYAYQVRDGGIIGTNGESVPLYCRAEMDGVWSIPAGTVTTISTDPPSGVVLTCANPVPGTPGSGTETSAKYRARVLQAQRAAGLGMPSYLRTIISAVPGVEARLVAVQQQDSGWKVLVGGGDPYDVAYAIYQGISDISRLLPSTMYVVNITNDTNAVVTTDFNHGLVTGQKATIYGIAYGMFGINGVPLTVTVIDAKNFATGVDTTTLLPYSTGGYVTPNPRNVAPLIVDFPDRYSVPFVVPPLQLVVIDVTWNTLSSNRVSNAAISSLAAPAIAAYINSIYAGQPISLYDLECTFKNAAAPYLPSNLLTRMVFAVSIDGIGVAAEPGTGTIAGDSESYMWTPADGSKILIARG